MIVCQCGVVTDTAVNEAVDEGACTLKQVCQATCAGQDCGGCVFFLKRLMSEHQVTASQAGDRDVPKVGNAAS